MGHQCEYCRIGHARHCRIPGPGVNGDSCFSRVFFISLEKGTSSDLHTSAQLWHHEIAMAERNDLTAKTEAAPAAAGDGHAGEEVAGQSFFSLVATQFLGAFNDNVFRQLILLVAVDLSIEADEKFYQPLAGALFALPFVLLSGFAGSLADRFSKTSIIRFCKGWEILVMLLGGAAFYIGNIPLLFFCLFLMGAQSAFFGPGKYGIIPELIPSRSLSKANGIILMTTYLAIILGIASAGLLKDDWRVMAVSTSPRESLSCWRSSGP